jgi:hypothetical protein
VKKVQRQGALGRCSLYIDAHGHAGKRQRRPLPPACHAGEQRLGPDDP